MSQVRIRPLGSWVLLCSRKGAQTPGGIIFPDAVDSRHFYVEALADEVTDLEVGDEVMHIPDAKGVAHSEVKDCFLVPRSAIIAVVER